MDSNLTITTRMNYYLVRRVFVGCIGCIYVIAFVSYMVQWRSLMSINDGITPITNQLSTNHMMFISIFQYHEHLGIDMDQMIVLICVVGLMCSVLMCVGYGSLMINMCTWLCYLQLIGVSHPWLDFQWDILLCEVGFLTALWSPLIIPPYKTESVSHTMVWVIRFVLFKLMLMSGLAKIQSEGPTWFHFTALHYHFATQCIPTPLAWYARHLPPILLKWGVRFTFVVEIGAVFLILMPFRVCRYIAIVSQVLLQIFISLTGNYTFFNLLTIALCVTLLDDRDLRPWFYPRESQERKSLVHSQLEPLLGRDEDDDDDDDYYVDETATSITGHRNDNMYGEGVSIVSFVDKVDSHYSSHVLWCSVVMVMLLSSYFLWYDHIDANMANSIMSVCRVLPMVFSVFTLVLATVFLRELLHTGHRALGATFTAINQMEAPPVRFGVPPIVRVFMPVTHSWSVVVSRLLVGLASLFVFSASAPHFQSVCPSLQWRLPIFSEWALHSLPPTTVNGYGLFRRITGVGIHGSVERPELVIERSYDQHCNDDSSCVWIPYEFAYKPGDVDRAPPWIAPIQPRLDWQIWFEALHDSPAGYKSRWFISFLCRLSAQNEHVLNLLDTTGMYDNGNNDVPPKFLRIRRFFYDFSGALDVQRGEHWQQGRWWMRHTRQTSEVIQVSDRWRTQCEHMLPTTTKRVCTSTLCTFLDTLGREPTLVCWCALLVVVWVVVCRLLLVKQLPFRELLHERYVGTTSALFSTATICVVCCVLAAVNVLALFILTVFGFVLSMYMYNASKGDPTEPACDMNGSCTKVSQSRYSRLMCGTSNTVWGMMYYGGMSLLVVAYGMISPTSYWMVLVMQFASALCLLLSLYLAYLLTHVVQLTCVVCTSVYMINVALFLGLCAVSHRAN